MAGEQRMQGLFAIDVKFVGKQLKAIAVIIRKSNNWVLYFLRTHFTAVSHI